MTAHGSEWKFVCYSEFLAYHVNSERAVAAVRERPQVLLRVLIMLIMHDFAALRGGTGALKARYGRVLLQC